MAIAVGSRLPDATFRVMTPDGPASRTTDDIFAGKRVVLFAVPGAFTPTCSNSHLPGFLTHYDAFKAKGIDTVACTAVNDVHVLNAWAKATGADGGIIFLSDGNGDFARAIGLDQDGTASGLGLRSKRYAMLVEDGVVKALNIDEQRGSTEMSAADVLLAAI
jgi:glutaredoxin/glutathione-dependent peroxiredoxin